MSNDSNETSHEDGYTSIRLTARQKQALENAKITLQFELQEPNLSLGEAVEQLSRYYAGSASGFGECDQPECEQAAAAVTPEGYLCRSHADDLADHLQAEGKL